jgi:hypothetical protein
VQNAKDTFYEVLRGRIAVLSPDRTVVVRGVTRPGVLVEENELVAAAVVADCFRVEWVGASVDVAGAMPVVALECEIAYETAGTAINAGMDRGRALGAMDGELLAALNACPQNAVKMNYAGLVFGRAAVAMSTNVWWGEVKFGGVVVKDDRVARTVSVAVMNYEEAAEL